MTSKPAKRSAGARKAWRVRNQMKIARQKDRRLVVKLSDDLMKHAYWPNYMNRALPNPWLQ